MSDRETMQQALEALQYGKPNKAITILREALEQPEQEPVDGTREGFEKWAKSLPNYMDISRFEAGYSDCNTDYAWAGWQAAQRPWVGLTDEDKKKIATAAGCTEDDDGHIVTEIFRLAEAQLRERNT
jgi:hypothetical protein